MNKENLINEICNLVEPIVIGEGYELYHVEYTKESGEYYLRIYIDNEKGIGLDDCEKVSRKISDMLDIEDPIKESYYLEVSSPGVERVLYSDKHLQDSIDKNVTIRLTKKLEGKKIFEGALVDYNDDEVKLNSNNSILNIPRSIVKEIALKGDF